MTFVENSTAASFESDADQRSDDPQTRLHCAGPRAGYLRDPAGAPPMGDRYFQDTETCARGAHLHLQVPAIGHLAHPEAFQDVPANGAEWAHIGVTDAVKTLYQRPRE